MDDFDNIDVGGGWSPAIDYTPTFDNSFWSDIGDIDTKYGSVDVPDLSTLPSADYSNEGNNYPTPESTQGSGGSPVNSSTSGSSLNLSGLANLFKSLTQNSKGELDYAKILPLLYGLYGAAQPNSRTQQAGYQGGIPRYTATRQAAGPGQRLSGNVLFSKPDGTVVNPSSATAPTAVAPSAPAAPSERGGSGADSFRKDAYRAPTYADDPEYIRLRDAARRARPGGESMTMDVKPEEQALDRYVRARTGPSVIAAAQGGTLHSGGFVIPADVVSHMGNGSSDAGLKLLASKLGAKPIKGGGDGMSDSIPTTIDGREKALVAHEEAYLTPQQVARIGGGDASKGAKKLREMMARIREARTGTTEQGKQINPAKFMPGGSVHRYAAGGATGVTGVSAAANAGVTGTEESLANWAGPYVTDMLAKGQALSELPFEQYSGPLTAGPSALQTQAFNTAGTLQPSSAIGQAAGTAGGLATAFQNLNYNPVGSTFDTAAAQQYMNPYLSAALDPQLKELQRQNQIANLEAAGRLTRAGAFGGGRQAVMNAENQRNMLDKTNQLLSQGYSTAYDKAMAQFNADQQRKVQEAQFGSTLGLQGLQGATQAAQTQGQLGVAQSAADLNALKTQADLGAVQQGLAQADVAANRAAFEEARVNPFKMVQFQQSLLQGLPLAATTYNQAPTNNLTQFAQGLTTLQGALKALGITPG